jgi:phosphoserine phosphatase RsbU/P
MFYGQFDCDNKVLRYVNAGHNPPILISPTRVPRKVSAGDLPVGLFPDVRYQELQIALPTGAAILLYTDGITDALNSRGDEFGEERLISCCASLPKAANAETICQMLSNAVAEWPAGVEQFDDITILVLVVE